MGSGRSTDDEAVVSPAPTYFVVGVFARATSAARGQGAVADRVGVLRRTGRRRAGDPNPDRRRAPLAALRTQLVPRALGRDPAAVAARGVGRIRLFHVRGLRRALAVGGAARREEGDV
eukprot:3802113-Prymnesium_polylepis.2